MADVIREFSAGVVPYFETDGQLRFLLLLSGLTRGELWEFPKGLIEKGEDSRTAALREFQEETGIPECTLVPGFRSVLKYFYRRESKLVAKSVTYYLGEVRTADVKLSHESSDFAWVTKEEARRKLRHKNLWNLLEDADRFLKARASGDAG